MASYYPSYSNPAVLPEFTVPQSDLSNLLRAASMKGRAKSSGRESASKLPKIKGTVGEITRWQTENDALTSEINELRTTYGFATQSLERNPDYIKAINRKEQVNSPGNFAIMGRNADASTDYLDYIKDKGSLFDIESLHKGLGLHTYGKRGNDMESAGYFDDYRQNLNFRHSLWGQAEVHDWLQTKWSNLGKDETGKNAIEIKRVVKDQILGRAGLLKTSTYSAGEDKADNEKQVLARLAAINGIDENVLHGFEQGFLSDAVNKGYIKEIMTDGRPNEKYGERFGQWIDGKMVSWAASALSSKKKELRAGYGDAGFTEFSEEEINITLNTIQRAWDDSQDSSSVFWAPQNEFVNELSDNIKEDRGKGKDLVDKALQWGKTYGHGFGSDNWGSVDELGDNITRPYAMAPRERMQELLNDFIYNKKDPEVSRQFESFKEFLGDPEIVNLIESYDDNNSIALVRDHNTVNSNIRGLSDMKKGLAKMFSGVISEKDKVLTLEARATDRGLKSGTNFWWDGKKMPLGTIVTSMDDIKFNVPQAPYYGGKYHYNEEEKIGDLRDKVSEVNAKIKTGKVTENDYERFMYEGYGATIASMVEMPFSNPAEIEAFYDWAQSNKGAVPNEIHVPKHSVKELDSVDLNSSEVKEWMNGKNNFGGMKFKKEKRKKQEQINALEPTLQISEQIIYRTSDGHKFTEKDIKNIYLDKEDVGKKYAIKRQRNRFTKIPLLDNAKKNKAWGTTKDNEKASVEVNLNPLIFDQMDIITTFKDGKTHIAFPAEMNINSIFSIDPKVMSAHIQESLKQRRAYDKQVQNKGLEILELGEN